MKIKHTFLPLLLLLTACVQQPQERLTQYVNPLIGSGGHGHVFVGASVPFGMVQAGPTSVTQAWDWCSGYHRSDSTVIGFSHTHLSGTGCGDLFDITVMPVTGDVTYSRGKIDDPQSGLWSYANRDEEVTKVSYYSVPLTRYNIKAEITATARTGVHRYTYPASQEAALVFDLQNGGCWDQTIASGMETVGNNRIVGYRYSTGWARAQRVYFAAELSKPFDTFELHGKDNMYGRASFTTQEGEEIILKVAISPVSIEGAIASLEQEALNKDFDTIVAEGEEAWEKELSRIKITSNDVTQKRIFYTALYHSMIAPMLLSDINGDYMGADGKVYNSPTPHYTGLSLWDTYRIKQPMMTIIDPERAGEFVATMIDICDKQGDLPVWHLWANETNCMVGDPAIPIVADAIVKGIKGFDYEKAFASIIQTTDNPERGKDLRNKLGYIPCDVFNESVAYELEYALADAAVANAAKALGKTEEAERFTQKSHSYRIHFDKASGFLRGVDSNGKFREPFNPFYSSHRADDYCEGNAWQYTWLVPHDVFNYAELFGGKDKMIAKLDTLFTLPSTIEGEPSPDISGLIGQYAHGNEPSHHILYMYTMLGEPHKAAKLIREVMKTQYRDDYDGLSGNEDMGQMSAWYIMTALGFYEVEPASARYWFGSPTIDRAELVVEGGTFVVETINNSDENIYIKSIKLNDVDYPYPYIMHSDIAKGGKLVFEMCDTPTKWYSDETIN